MKCYRAESLLEEIDVAIKDINGFNIKNDLEKSYLAKFLVVFICGIYEEVVETIIMEKVEKLRSPQLSTFMEQYLKVYFRNPDTENTIRLLGKFDVSWSSAIKQESKEIKDALDSIVSNKNALAHGSISTITLDEVKIFYEKSRKLIEKIDEVVLVDSPTVVH